MAKPLNILICPLNWGLGHATRCVPIINQYVSQGNHIIMVADGKALAFLQQEFPQLPAIRLKGYSMSYWPGPFLSLGLMMQMPWFALGFIIEHYRLKKIVKQNQIDLIISDNRYGLWHKEAKSILITHQLYIQMPSKLKWMEKPLHLLTRIMVNRFHHIWVPDFESPAEGLSGALSHGTKINKKVIFIGPLSRFKNIEIPGNFDMELPDVLILLSGPGSQKQKLAEKFIELLIDKPSKVLLVGGNPQKAYQVDRSNIRQVNHLPTPVLAYLLKHSPKIIARAGYSTIMDLHVLGRKAILVPTPGQWEQEYLAKNLVLQQDFVFIEEKDIYSIIK